MDSLEVILIVLTAFVLCVIVIKLVDYFSYYSDLKSVKNNYKYVNLSYKDVINLYKCGVHFNHYYNFFYFTTDICDDDTYVILPYFESLRLLKFLEKERVNKNESQRGYEYLINKINSYSKENSDESNDCLEKAAEGMKKCYDSGVDIKEFIKELESIKF